MPSPGAPAPSRVSIEDSYLELLVDTLDMPARGQFLQRYFRVIAHLDLREPQCLQIWDDMLARRRELSDRADRQISVITALYNRRLFAETFEKELNRARRYSHPLGLVMLDLHRFKEVNDKHGHPRGDEVLRAAAATLKKALRTSDYAFRIGGDEFALLLPQTDAEQALALARRVETVFAEMLQPLQLTVGVSMDHGVANFPQDGEQADQLIRIADERLYRLKHTNHSRKGNGSPRTVTPDAQEEPTAAPAPPPVDRTAPIPP